MGDDLAEGKPTLPLLHVIKHGNAEEQALVRGAIEQGGLDDLPRVMAAIERTGALAYTRRQAEAESRAAKEALNKLPDSNHRNYLLQLTEFAVTRNF